ncbi:BglG family transcription antiterminator [Lacticaseibacillus casei]|jgi:lichenan operon transcriptional antiterminator|uniref:PRD domain-containing protein n=1 Tax=Lacticaseibacillus huelsenbergensis TaxID=3035291 RepID=A0ABY8DMP9_9LACO|nr:MULTISPECIES: PRD domain-containing protein [Lacticaseibacillus]MDG3062650.1 PRD domain-containing protein [Lacticaseibacillus sp. BCRC 81376]QVI38460.1 BglG family transcription antiterminator [Lacticaseibacillus casei]QXG60274.1 BglG family transcription antiterminator [Lacticaseibacillus casei]WFB38250.1 PRD domain-containing protein [Lacticaseibacillus huelsenbergensis]WFB42674.1 PRD domain-containing protein [Lacticaseibacillus huelsenbergensis]
MKQKERELLLYLVENQDQYVTSKDLANTLLMTPRTVRSYVKSLKAMIEKYGASLEAKPSFGYRLHILHPVAFDLFLNQHKVLSPKVNDTVTASESIDRQNYILNKLLIEDEALLMDDLAERLFVSRSTLSKDMISVREKLEPYALHLESRANKGFYVVGTERNRRHFILDYFFSHGQNNFQRFMENKSFFADVSFEQLTIVVIDECREASLRLSDFIIQNIVLYLALSIERVRKGNSLPPVKVEQAPEHQRHYAVAERIMERIARSTGLQFSESEVAYLAIQLVAMAKGSPQDSNDQALWKDMDQVLRRIEAETGYPVSTDYALRKSLAEHIKPMLVRLQQGIQLKNPLLKEIKTHYPQYFADTKRFLGMSKILSAYTINDDETAYMAMHLMAAVEKYHNAHKLRTLIICATGYGSAELLNNRVQKEFGETLNIVGVKGYYEVDDESLADVDLIISAIDLSTQVLRVPVIQVSVFLGEMDVRAIRQFLETHNRPHGKAASKVEAIAAVDKSIFDQFTDSSRFVRWTEPVNRETVLNRLCAQVALLEPANFADELKAQVHQREQMSSITFSQKIVVPHPAMPIGQFTQIAIGVIPAGLKWSESFPAVQLVFLLSPSYLGNRGLTSITQTIVALTDHADWQASLVAASDFKSFRHRFLQMMEEE